MSFELIDGAEERLYEVVDMMRYQIEQAQSYGKPIDFSCLKLNEVDMEALHNLYDTCKNFMREYTFLEDHEVY